MVLLFGGLAGLQVLLALFFKALGLGLDLVFLVAVVLGGLLVAIRIGSALVGGQGIQVLLDALGLEEGPLVRRLALSQHALVLFAERLAAGDGLQAAHQGRQHGQHGDGHRHPGHQLVAAVRRVLGVLGVLVVFQLFQRTVRHGAFSWGLC